MYAIRGFCHRLDNNMGGHGFCVDLSPSFREAVKASGITGEMINHQVKTMGRLWLDASGHDARYDPDNIPVEIDRKNPPANAKPLFEPLRDIRVAWGEWGPEHISVPGNACGLDIDRSGFFCMFDGGVCLQPHNVDSWRQKYLLTVAFTEIAESVLILGRSK